MKAQIRLTRDGMPCLELEYETEHESDLMHLLREAMGQGKQFHVDWRFLESYEPPVTP